MHAHCFAKLCTLVGGCQHVVVDSCSRLMPCTDAPMAQQVPQLLADTLQSQPRRCQSADTAHHSSRYKCADRLLLCCGLQVNPGLLARDAASVQRWTRRLNFCPLYATQAPGIIKRWSMVQVAPHHHQPLPQFVIANIALITRAQNPRRQRTGWVLNVACVLQAHQCCGLWLLPQNRVTVCCRACAPQRN